MKLFAIIAVSSVLSHGTLGLQTSSLKSSIAGMLNRVHANRVLPALDYYFFAA